MEGLVVLPAGRQLGGSGAGGGTTPACLVLALGRPSVLLGIASPSSVTRRRSLSLAFAARNSVL